MKSKKVYKNKKTGQVIVSGENLDKRQWEFVREFNSEIKKKDGMMRSNQVIKKKK